MKRIILAVLLLLFLTSHNYAQGVRHVNIAQGSVKLAGSSGFSGNVPTILAGAQITVCTGSTLPALGTTCTGLASIFSDIGLTQVLNNPTNADGGGNYSFYASGGLPYVVSVSSVGFTTFSYVWSAPLSSTIVFIQSSSPNPASVGFLRLASSDVIAWRNSTNTADVFISKLSAAFGNIPADTFNTNGTQGFYAAFFADPSTTTATSGTYRLSSGATLSWRNNANSADIPLSKNSSDNILFNGIRLVDETSTETLTNKSTSTGSLVGVVASGTATMTTALIAAGACGTIVGVSNPNVLSTDVVSWSFNAAPAANPGQLVVSAWPIGATSVQFQYCNPTAGSITPNAATLNWKVVR